jgi:hypothetical protein
VCQSTGALALRKRVVIKRQMVLFVSPQLLCFGPILTFCPYKEWHKLDEIFGRVIFPHLL